jgi:hypothetical protein
MAVALNRIRVVMRGMMASPWEVVMDGCRTLGAQIEIERLQILSIESYADDPQTPNHQRRSQP